MGPAGFKGTEWKIEVGYRRKKEQKQWEGREVLEEPVWEELRFPKEASEVLDYPQQNHANREIELAENIASRGSRRGFQWTEKFPWEE